MTLPPLDARDLKARVDLAAFAGQYTWLRRSGRQLVGLCPLHRERHPSFYVHPQRQIFYCFGCERGGDVYSLVMILRGCLFPEAVAEVVRFLGSGEATEAPAIFAGAEGAGGGAPRPAKQAAAHSWKRKPESAPRSFSVANRWPSVEECAAERAFFTCQEPDNWP